ncbi:hypothetical protein [Motiliproteus sp. SC1-56]|uniref:hypothetical protein n=1 Tax=Motiliproteus sp. SC1-56 TaxID=2799565 RepID=UPI001A8D5E0C|nr:hypothetical protein [Motiliproteus sp. SC1-56]
MESLLIWKLVVSVGAVLGLALVAEHVSARVAGVLSGYPLGSAIALGFIGIEQGAAFAATAARHTLLGFSASLVLVYCYYLGSRSWERGHLLLGACSAIAGFAAAAFILRPLNLGLAGGVVMTLLMILLFYRLFRAIPNLRIEQRVQLSYGVLLLRALMAAATVILITALAHLIGPAWSGLLSAFPITLFPFLLVLHYSYGRGPVYTVIKNYPLGLGALMCYVVTVTQSYPALGVGWGTAVAFAVATLYLLGLGVWMGRRQRQVA